MLKQQEKEKQIYKKFLDKYKVIIDMSCYALTYENNNILFDSINRCFFYNLNFPLIGIMNNLLNRLPNIKNYASSDKLYYVSNVLDTNLYSFIDDLKFLVKYWNDLFKYLGFDYYKNIIINELYKKYYGDTNQTIEFMLLNRHMIEMNFFDGINKRVKQIRKNKRSTKHANSSSRNRICRAIPSSPIGTA